MVSDKKIASAVGAKTARACDYCIRRRARWYCAADDAFLCQVCDGSVHSANHFARRHERVRLKIDSLKRPTHEVCLPTWHRGLTKKARTPRQRKEHYRLDNRASPVVPEIDFSTSQDDGHEEEHLLYRVPTFDPFVAELSTSTVTSNDPDLACDVSEAVKGKSKSIKSVLLGDDVQDGASNSSHRFLPSDFDLAEFAADVETLLGKGLDGESYGIEELGLLDCHEKGSVDCSISSGREALIKAEKEEFEVEGIVLRPWHKEGEMDMIREPFELCFNYDSPTTCEEGEMKVVTEPMARETEEICVAANKKISLRLDYDAISTAWADQGSPWMNGKRPDINPDDCWPQSSMKQGPCGTKVRPYGELGLIGGQAPSGDGGREARVLRYREKRRTRLFSKKIRYEVRKLNAEKRPRVKGRFVKRTSFTPTPLPLVGK